jgi:alpha-glucosidase
MKLFTEGPARLNSAYGFNFLYAQNLTADLVGDTMQLWPGEDGEGWPSWAFSNHDAPRVVSRWLGEAEPTRFAALAMLLLMSLRGNIFLYQGEELGLPQAHVPFERLRDPEAIANWPETQGRDGARTPMPWTGGAPNAGFSTSQPWLPVDPDHVALSVDRQERDPRSTLALTRRLIALRKDREALRTGAIRRHDAAAPLLVFERGEGAEQLLCVFNLGGGSVQHPLPRGWRILESVGGASEQGLPATSGYIAERG